MEAMIVVDNISKEFIGTRGETIRAVDGLSFQCARGEIYGLLGPNGAGKTTTLRILGGLMTPKSGRISVAGFDVSRNTLEVRKRVGYMAATTGLYERLTASELLRYVGGLYGIAGDALRRRIADLAELLDMAAFLEQRCGALSSGQKQRVSLARTLIHEPPVLILDEPTLGLDVVSNRVVLRFIRKMAKDGRTVIMSTHQMGDAERVCTRFGLIHQGHLTAEGTLGELSATTGRKHLADIFLAVAGVPGLEIDSLVDDANASSAGAPAEAFAQSAGIAKPGAEKPGDGEEIA
jgi:sodium transport system ATP-binding protein